MAKNCEQLKNLCHKFPIVLELKELTANIYTSQLRTSRTGYELVTIQQQILKFINS